MEPLLRCDQVRIDGKLTLERDRCKFALDLASQGVRVSLISSGDRKGNYDKYTRPGLNAFIPVDDAGNLKAPNDFLVDRIIANQSEMKAQFKEGDHAPAETAWRRSSDYPFATQIINALTSPARYFGVLWDTARIFQNPAGQYVYSTTGTAVQPKDFVFLVELCF